MPIVEDTGSHGRIGVHQVLPMKAAHHRVGRMAKAIAVTVRRGTNLEISSILSITRSTILTQLLHQPLKKTISGHTNATHSLSYLQSHSHPTFSTRDPNTTHHPQPTLYPPLAGGTAPSPLAGPTGIPASGSLGMLPPTLPGSSG